MGIAKEQEEGAGAGGLGGGGMGRSAVQERNAPGFPWLFQWT